MKLATNHIASFRYKYPQATKAAIFTLLLICGFVLVNTFELALKSELTQPLPQDAAVKVYFNHNPASKYKDPYRYFIREGDNLENQIINAINQAHSTVDVAVMEFTAVFRTVSHKFGRLREQTREFN